LSWNARYEKTGKKYPDPVYIYKYEDLVDPGVKIIIHSQSRASAALGENPPRKLENLKIHPNAESSTSKRNVIGQERT
jgi:hypothetical protein